MGTVVRNIIGVILCLLFYSSFTYSQIVTKVLVSGSGGQHDIDVQTSFERGYASYNGTNFPGTITRYVNGCSGSFAYAKANNYQLMIRSTTGINGAVTLAASYPEVQLVMPSGSNLFISAYSGDIASCPVIVTGAGDDSNETGYKVEFFAQDIINGEPDLSSFGNGFVAGQLAYLANTLNKPMSQVRLLARLKTIEINAPDKYSGYGKINEQTILNSVLPVELNTFTAIVYGNKINLKWNTSTEKNNYGFEIERASLGTMPGQGNSLGTTPGQGTSLETPGMSVWEKVGFVTGSSNSNSMKEYSFVDKNLSEGKYQYRLKQIDNDGQFEYSKTVEVSVINPGEYTLEQNYPNPFNPSTVIQYSIMIDCNVKLTVYDALGNEMEILLSGEQSAGKHEVLFDGSKYASGVYYYLLQAENYTETKRMILLK